MADDDSRGTKRGHGAKADVNPRPTKRARREFTPMQRPVSGRRGDPGPVAEMVQPVPRMAERPAQARGFPDAFTQQVQARRQALASRDIGEPGYQAVQGFSKVRGTSKTVKKMAAQQVGGLRGANQSGLYPGHDAHVREDIPEHMDYRGQRASQVLSQLSEVMLHGASQAGLSPVEVQFGYGRTPEGELSLFASANKPEVQDWLHQSLQQPAGTHLAAAALSDNPELRNLAAKLLFPDEQRARREAAPGATEEHGPDMDLAGQLLGKFLDRDLTVVGNASGKSGRHAEQNIAVAMHDANRFSEGDIQGTKIRCHSCRASIGLNLRDASGTGMSGKAYASQAAVEHFRASLAEVAAGHERIVRAQPQRPRADSMVSLPALTPPAAQPSSSPAASPTSVGGKGPIPD